MRLERMTWVQVEKYFTQKDTVIIAIGSIECHGRHAALGADTLVPNRLLEMIELKSDVLILPTIPYGNADFHTDFPGTVSIGGEGLYGILNSICSNALKWGAKRFIVLNGHGGNMSAIERVSRSIYESGAAMAIINWWEIVGQLNPQWVGGHGGCVETSALLAISENLVDMNQIAPFGVKNLSDNIVSNNLKTAMFKNAKVVLARSTRLVTDNGWMGPDDPKNSTAEQGEQMLQTITDYVLDFIDEFEKVQL